MQGKARRGFGRGEQGAPKQPGLLTPPTPQPRCLGSPWGAAAMGAPPASLALLQPARRFEPI